jgi:hypothetical protein
MRQEAGPRVRRWAPLNICNANRNACTLEQAETAQAVLHWMKVADNPWFISLNEICEETMHNFAALWNADAWMVISKREEGGCPGPRTSFGNVIFFPGGVFQDMHAWYFSQAAGKNCADPDTECRTMLCVKTATVAGPMNKTPPCSPSAPGSGAGRSAAQRYSRSTSGQHGCRQAFGRQSRSGPNVAQRGAGRTQWGSAGGVLRLSVLRRAAARGGGQSEETQPYVA